jgi:U3 small nucleolar ribonucleoprotein protein IMP3
LKKIYNLGILPTKTRVSDLETKVTVSALCRRRIGVVMARLKMAETITIAVRFVEQGHVRVGNTVISDPSFLIPQNMVDYLTWVNSSKIKRKIMTYNDKLDDMIS